MASVSVGSGAHARGWRAGAVGGAVVTPYYQHGGIRIYCGDARVVLPTLDLRGVGAVFADPPYAETSCDWDRWPAGWPSVVASCIPSIAPMWCCGSMRMFLDRRDEFAAWKLAQDIVWEKHNGSGFHADRFRRVHEHVLQWYRGDWESVHKSPVYTNDATARTMRRKKRPNHWGQGGGGHIDAGAYEMIAGGPRMMRSVMQVSSCHGDGGTNPTRKPLGLIEPLLRYSLAPGRVLLDVFCGNGAALIAAKMLGREAIGFDVRESECEAAANRCAQTLALGGDA